MNIDSILTIEVFREQKIGWPPEKSKIYFILPAWPYYSWDRPVQRKQPKCLIEDWENMFNYPWFTSFNNTTSIVWLLEYQVVGKSAEDCRIVFNDEDFRHAGSCKGIRTEKVLPRPTSLDTSNRPLCVSTIWRASVSPSPVPAMRSVLAERTR